MITKPGLLLLALLLSGCASRAQQARPIAAVAEQRQCPAFPLPPSALIKAPAKTDFLHPTD